ncbi:MAG: hypothetical protein ABF278_00460 [Wenyingzhuangia sp.]|jgi:hypothetical protein|uniref:hypothetical protein n=1 Tax=Wenyingzhuangia sp. TaxID=1964193 RepID=UPI00321BB3C5
MNTKKKKRSKNIFREFVDINSAKITFALDTFFKGLKSEAKDTKTTTLIIQQYVFHKGKISKEDEKFLKRYVYDLLKIAGIGIPFILLPGASIIIPFLLKSAKKRNISLMPSNFKSENIEIKKSRNS